MSTVHVNVTEGMFGGHGRYDEKQYSPPLT
jgi:hypothetical protein